MKIGSRKFMGNGAYKEWLRVGNIEKIVTKVSLRSHIFAQANNLKVIGEIATSTILENEFSKQIHLTLQVHSRVNSFSLQFWLSASNLFNLLQN